MGVFTDQHGAEHHIVADPAWFHVPDHNGEYRVWRCTDEGCEHIVVEGRIPGDTQEWTP